MSHLTDMTEFVGAFAKFRQLLIDKGVVFKDEENVFRLFDVWLANFKDEKVLDQQLKPHKEPWEQDDDAEPPPPWM